MILSWLSFFIKEYNRKESNFFNLWKRIKGKLTVNYVLWRRIKIMICGLFYLQSNSVAFNAICSDRTGSFEIIIYVTPETAGDRVWLYATYIIVMISDMQMCDINPIVNYENPIMWFLRRNAKFICVAINGLVSSDFVSGDFNFDWTILQIHFRQPDFIIIMRHYTKSSNADAIYCI